jgi:hypothetical protein
MTANDTIALTTDLAGLGWCNSAASRRVVKVTAGVRTAAASGSITAVELISPSKVAGAWIGIGLEIEIEIEIAETTTARAEVK